MSEDFSQRLNEARRGDRAALGDLLLPHLAELNAYVRLRLDGPLARRESAVDLVQSVCRDVIDDIQKLDGDGEATFRAWLFAMARHKIAHRRDHHAADRRDVKREETFFDSRVNNEAILGSYTRIVTPSGVAMGHEEIDRIEAAFDALPDHYRDVIVDICIAGLGHGEVAKRIGKDETAVRQLLHRARARLATKLS